jgi:hypothetical protein
MTKKKNKQKKDQRKKIRRPLAEELFGFTENHGYDAKNDTAVRSLASHSM